MNAINDLLKDVDRSLIVRAVAGYLLVYALVNICGGVCLTIIGGLSGFAGAASQVTFEQSESLGVDSDDLQEGRDAASSLMALGGLVIIQGIISVITAPLFLAAAFGLFQRKAWSRMATVIALGASIVLSLLTVGTSFITSIFWIAVGAFVIYFFMTDEALKAELSR